MHPDLKQIEKLKDIITTLKEIIKENKIDIADNLHTSYAQYKIRENNNLEFAVTHFETAIENIMFSYTE